MVICGSADHFASWKNMSPTEVKISRLPCGDSCKGCLGCPGYDASEDELVESFNITQFFASNAVLLEYQAC